MRKTVAELEGQRQGPDNLMSGCWSNQGRPAPASAEIEHQQAFLVDDGPRGPGICGKPQPVESQDGTVETGADQDVVPSSL